MNLGLWMNEMDQVNNFRIEAFRIEDFRIEAFRQADTGLRRAERTKRH